MKNFIFAISIIFLVSCSNEDNNIDNSGSGSLIKTVKKYTSGVLELETNYEYNSNGNITKMLQNFSYGKKVEVNFSYDSNGEMTAFEEITTDPFGEVTTEIDNLMYQNGIIVKICQEITPFDGPSSFDYPEVDKIEFVYDNMGNVNLFTHYYPEEAEFYSCEDVNSVEATENLEYDDDGNMKRYENSEYFFTPTYLKYTYDDKNHPYANLKPDAYRKLIGFSTVNNIASAEEYNADTDEILGTVSFDYVFNGQNYPTKLTRTYTSGGSSQTLVFEYGYY